MYSNPVMNYSWMNNNFNINVLTPPANSDFFTGPTLVLHCSYTLSKHRGSGSFLCREESCERDPSCTVISSKILSRVADRVPEIGLSVVSTS